MTAGELLAIVGVNRIDFNKWVRQGLLDLEEVASGARRFYSYEDLKRCLAMKALSTIGLRPFAAIRLIRDRADHFEKRGVRIAIDWQAIDTKVNRLARYESLEG